MLASTDRHGGKSSLGVQNLCLPRVIDTRASGFVITNPMLAKSDRQPFGLSFVPNFDTVCSPKNQTSKATAYLLFVLLPVVLGRSLYVLWICQRNETQLRIKLSRSDTLSIGSQRNKAKRATESKIFQKSFEGKKKKPLSRRGNHALIAALKFICSYIT